MAIRLRATEVACRCRVPLAGAVAWLVLAGLLPDSARPDGEAPQKLSPRERQQLQRRVVNLTKQGKRLYDQARYPEAARLWENIIELQQRLYPKEQYRDGHPDLALSLNSLGVMLQAQGQCARAGPYHRQAVTIFQRFYPKGHADLATALHNLGAGLKAEGEYAQAEAYYRQALEMGQRLFAKGQFPPGQSALASGLNDLGALLQAQGENARAEAYFRQALEAYEKLYPEAQYPAGHPELATCLINLGVVRQAQGEYARAEPVFRQAVAMCRRLYPQAQYAKFRPNLASSLNNLAGLLRQQGQYDQAEAYYREALELDQKLYPEAQYPQGHPALARVLNNLGSLQAARGEYARAEPYYRQALEMCRRLYPQAHYPRGHPTLALGLHNLGCFLLTRGEYDRAEPLLRDALAMYQGLAEHLAVTAAQALNYAASLPLTRDVLLSLTRDRVPDPALYELLWQGRGTVTRALERRHRDLLASRDDKARTQGERIQALRRQLSALVLAPDPGPDPARRLDKLSDELESAEKELAGLLRLVAPAGRTAAKAEDLGNRLPEGTVFIDLLKYYRFQQDHKTPGEKGERTTPHYVAFLVRRGQPVRRVELGEARSIEAALGRWRRQIAAWRPGSPNRPAEDGPRLSKLLWHPLAEHLPAGTHTVYLCPDAELTGLPWAALPARAPGKILLEEHALAVVPHGQFLLKQLQAEAGAAAGPGPLLALGAVRYDQTPAAGPAQPAADRGPAPVPGGNGPHWPYLKGAERELEQVLALAGKRGIVALRGAEASTDRLLAELPRAGYAHLATHGFFADQSVRSLLRLSAEDYRRGLRGERIGVAGRNPLLLSGLVLAGANPKGENGPETWAADGGMVLGNDLLGLRLEGLRLAVLSACETGLGDVAGGEGAFGLQRAFHMAGAQNVVASLWKVDDDATSALMVLFYHKLWQEHRPPLEALRQAQLTLYRHPEHIKALAGARGIKLGKTVTLPAEAAQDPGPPADRAPVKLWAGFVLSGAGR
jgi:CHAT domain-containing protein/Tfp pilus assembly protein PilF